MHLVAATNHAVQRYRSRIDRDATEAEARAALCGMVGRGIAIWRGEDERLVILGRARMILVRHKAAWMIVTVWERWRWGKRTRKRCSGFKRFERFGEEA